MNGHSTLRHATTAGRGIFLGLAAGLLVCAGCQSALNNRPAMSSDSAGRLTMADDRGYIASHARTPRSLTSELSAAGPAAGSANTGSNGPNAARYNGMANMTPSGMSGSNSNYTSALASDGGVDRNHVRRVSYNGTLGPDGGSLPPNDSGIDNVALYPHRNTLASFGEKRMTTLPTYVIEPPDVLLIDALKVVPKAPYHIEPLDQIDIRVTGTLPDQPIQATYAVEPTGTVNLGPTYGRVQVMGMTLEEATHAVDQHLRRLLKEPEVAISLIASAGQQQISGEHLVGPDGSVNLGVYGSVYVTGLTLMQARARIEKQLSKYLENPTVAIDVFAYNSKVYYIISAGAGNGDSITKWPVTGNETVLDALAQVNGLTRANSKKVWIARPNPGGTGCDTILPVNFRDIVQGGSTDTNYQIFPGDRVYLEEDHWIAADSLIGKTVAPFERIFGFILLGSQSIQNLQTYPGGPSGHR